MTNPAKESLFKSLVEPVVQGLKELFLAGQTGFDALPQDIKREFETVIHDMSKAAAETYIRQLRRFFIAGWDFILNAKE